MASIKKMFVSREVGFLALFHRYLTDLAVDGFSSVRKSSFELSYKLDSWVYSIKEKNKLVPDLFDPILHKDIIVAITIISALNDNVKKFKFSNAITQFAFVEAEKELHEAVTNYCDIILQDVIEEYHKLVYYSLNPFGKLLYNIKYKFLKCEKTI